MDKTSLGDRMKTFENAWRFELPPRFPVIIRVDGKAFHTWTKKIKAEKPFDEKLMRAMVDTAIELCDEVQGAVFAYTQSDEISILVHYYKRFSSHPWFGNNLQKMVSITSSIASSKMTQIYGIKTLFDSRIFILPETEVVNYFIWRQQDASRNSIQMLAQANFSHKSLLGLSGSELQDKLMLEKQINWNALSSAKKRGSAIVKGNEGWGVDNEIPIFTKDREYIQKLLVLEEI